MPAARTAIRTSPALTGGSGRSSTRRTSGPPCPVRTTARMGRLYAHAPRRALSSVVRADLAADRGVVRGPAVARVAPGAAVLPVAAAVAEEPVPSRAAVLDVLAGAAAEEVV